MAHRRIRRVALVGAALIGGLVPTITAAQTLEGTGVVATGLLLRQMDGVKRVLMIGAHPDDENTSVLASLSRGMGAETAYLALTRGDGGQNLIGSELWDGLGVIRTGELEAARRLDGGRQFFTRAFDFGYSKRADEALTFWPREELLSDVVWVVRKFRPQVIITVFSGTPRDGHGQHQAAGIMAREAFAAAGDPGRFPEQLAQGVEAWSPSKLYQSMWRRSADATVVLETGTYDPLLGRSVLQLAMESRSFHRSQDMGAPRPMGPQQAGMILDRDVAGTDPASDHEVFAGVDTTLVAVASALSEPAASRTRQHLTAYRASLDKARDAFGGQDPFGVVTPLRDALDHLVMAQDAAASDGGTELRTVLARKIDLAQRALMAAAGVTVDVRAADDLVTPGQTFQVTVYAWNGGPLVLSDATAAIVLPAEWRAEMVRSEGLGPDGSLSPASLATWVYDVTLSSSADLSKLYYLRQSRDGEFYQWPDDAQLWGMPRDPAPVQGALAFSVPSGDRSVAVRTQVPWSYVGVNPARGEFRRPVLVVPAVSVSVTPGGMVWPLERSESRTITIALRNEAVGGSRGTVRLVAPDGWDVTPAEADFDVGQEGGERSFVFTVTPAGGIEPGEHVFRAEVGTQQGARFSEGFTVVDYEHIEPAAMFTPAEARINVIPVRVADGLRVGYIMGTGDDGPVAISQLGAEVTLLDEEHVRAGDFTGYDVVVVGVRAYETREDLKAANDQLLDYARAGGTVLVQYNQYDFPRGGYTPYPVEMNRPARRVAEQDAEVKVLQPDAPVFNSPNRITQDDFSGWVQERGLYFLSEWDDAYTPLIEMHDQDEDPARGSLLVAPVGEGLYVYAALSFFRQWSAGVPGPYRLFANLLSLKGEEWRRFRPIS